MAAASRLLPRLTLPLLVGLAILSLLVFQSGFLLKRIQLAHKSTCADVSLRSSSCWLPARFGRVVLVVIDALRYDFVDSEADGAPWRGQMGYTRDLVRKGAFLTRALADPPTTTLQRLKALGTGGLPTFIDAKDNFDSDAEVSEDNVLYQLTSLGRNATLLGDNTWQALYPTAFHRSFALDSFDIHDLHTVDNHILEHLASELARDDWSLLVAHFLGVDHAGHKYGPNHPEMGAKLRQMDRVIKDVVATLAEGDLMIVMGDHGMTGTGDHGGESDDEVTAAFLAFSPGAPFSTSPPHSIHQVDVTPTLSLLLDLPIPFSSLGSPIDGLFADDTARKHAVHLTAMQIERFASTYTRTNGGIALSLPAELPSTLVEQRDLIARLQSSLRAQWTQFSLPLMRIALFALLDTAVAFIVPASWPGFWLRSGNALLLCTLLMTASPESSTALSLLTLSLPSSLLHSSSFALGAVPFSPPSFSSLLPSILLILSFAFPFSNSFIISEPSNTSFLLSTLLIVWFISHRPLRSSLPILAFALLLLRIEPLFHRCREEERDCVQLPPPLPSSSLAPDSRLGRILFASLSLCILYLFSRPPSSPSRSPLHSLADSLFLPALLLTLLHFAQSLLPEPMASAHAATFRYIALSVYTLCLLSIILVTLSSPSPLRPLSLIRSLSLPLLLVLGDGLTPALLCHLALSWCLTALPLPPSALIPALLLSTPYSFYLLGHSPTLSTIPWQAAFVGLQGSTAPRLLSGSLVIAHLFGHCILFGPLAVMATRSARFGPVRLLLAGATVRIAASSFAVTLLRRHLMVWKIFAPHWIFDAISYIVLAVSLLLSLASNRRSFR